MEPRILEMESEKAAGSLRLRRVVDRFLPIMLDLDEEDDNDDREPEVWSDAAELGVGLVVTLAR